MPWDVHNYADETAGYMNLLDATANSVNTIFAQLVTVVGPSNVVTDRAPDGHHHARCNRSARSRSAPSRSTRSR